MQSAVPSGTGAMAVILGLDDEKVIEQIDMLINLVNTSRNISDLLDEKIRIGLENIYNTLFRLFNYNRPHQLSSIYRSNIVIHNR